MTIMLRYIKKMINYVKYCNSSPEINMEISQDLASFSPRSLRERATFNASGSLRALESRGEGFSNRLACFPPLIFQKLILRVEKFSSYRQVDTLLLRLANSPRRGAAARE